MTPKIDTVYVMQRFCEAGLTPLFSEYKNNATPLLFRCNCGREDYVKWVHFITEKKHSCWYCKHSIKGTLEEKTRMLLYLMEQKEVAPGDSFIYPGDKTPFRVVCKCGEIVETEIRYLWAIKEGKRFKCKKCLSLDSCTPFEELQKKFTDKGATPLFVLSEYQNRQSLLKFMCVCGKDDTISVLNLRQITNLVCEECRQKRKSLSLEEAQQRFFDRNLIPLFTEYKSGRELLPYKMKCCGAEGKATLFDISKKGKYTTGKCIKCQSNERRVPFEEIKNEFENKKGLKILSTEEEYHNTHSVLRVQCFCGKEIHRSYADTVLAKSSGLCKECQFKLTRPRGKTHGRYSEFTNRERRQYEHYLWAKGVKERYENKCAISGETKNLVAHHLNAISHHKIDGLSLSNGIVLTKELHTKFHSACGFGNNTREQFEEWLKKEQLMVRSPKNVIVSRIVLMADLKNICKQLKISFRKEFGRYFIFRENKQISFSAKDVIEYQMHFSQEEKRKDFISRLKTIFSPETLET